MKATHTGRGRPLVLVHGLGNSSRAWEPIMPLLTAEREVIALDLPGHSVAPAERDSDSFAGLARSLETYLEAEGLVGCDMAGSSLGGQLVLEMARRNKAGATVALDPGGFWRGWERTALKSAITASLWAARNLKPGLPILIGNPVWRTMMLAPLSPHPWSLDPELVAFELAAFAETPTLDALIDNLAFGPPQTGPAGPAAGPVTIGWGRHDRLCHPAQAERALAAFPGARLHWFENSGHFPVWDEPEAAAKLILRASRGASRRRPSEKIRRMRPARARSPGASSPGVPIG